MKISSEGHAGYSVCVSMSMIGRGQGQIDIKWSKLAPLVSIDLRRLSKLHLHRERGEKRGVGGGLGVAVAAFPR